MWGTYLRCHDDIGWAIDDGDAASVGLNGFEHRRFLADFYAGSYPMSDARGLVFQENLQTGDRRISGSAASLIGIEAALASGDEAHLDLAIRRLLLAYQIVLGFGGLPLLYMGDELAQRNFYDFVDDPAHADDNRWVHRPPMDWEAAERRHVEGTVEHRVWHGLRQAVSVRSGLPSMDASVESEVMDPVNPAVLVLPAAGLDPDHGRALQHDARRAEAAALGGLAGQLVAGCAHRRDPADRRRDRAAAVPGPLAGPVGVTPSGLGEDAERAADGGPRGADRARTWTGPSASRDCSRVTLPGTRKLTTECALQVGRHGLSVRAFVARNPEADHEPACTAGCSNEPHPVRRRLRRRRLGDIYLNGRVSLAAVTADEVDRLLGAGRRDLRRQLQHHRRARLRRQHPAGVGLAPVARRVHRQPGRLHPPRPGAARGLLTHRLRG